MKTKKIFKTIPWLNQHDLYSFLHTIYDLIPDTFDYFIIFDR